MQYRSYEKRTEKYLEYSKWRKFENENDRALEKITE
jgi:hypothetical protein